MAKASELLSIARAELGTRESPANSNRVKYNTWYYGREASGGDYPWCAVFVQWCFNQAGEPLPARTASCGALMRAAQKAGLWVDKPPYRPGDVVIYDFPGGGPTDHCGIVERVSEDTVTDIEGNTGSASDADGGMVMRRERTVKYIVGAVRPEYEEEKEETMTTYKYLKDVPAAFRPVIDKLMIAGIIQGDGSDPSGNGDVIDLTHEQVRTLVFCYRGGAFDRKLKATGEKTLKT